MVYPDNLIQFPSLPNRPHLAPARYFETALHIGRGMLQLPFAPLEGRPHIADRLRVEAPANKARIGYQYVGIATRLKPAKWLELEKLEAGEIEVPEDPDATVASITKELDELSAMKQVGHDMMTHAVLDLEGLLEESDLPPVPISIIEKTVGYARRRRTDPQLLVPPGLVTDVQAQHATNMIEVYSTGR